MKKTISLLLALMLLISTVPAMALNYSGDWDNEATFETYTEVRENGPAEMKDLNPSGNYIAHPAMDGMNGDSVYVYRSANYYGRTAAVRINTNIVVYTGETFDDKAAARAYLEDLGLIAIIDEAVGSIVLVTPAPATGSSGSSGASAPFGTADQKNYYGLQTAMFAQGASVTVGEERFTALDAVYYGGFSYYYVIGIDDGATFLNNYVATVDDFTSRIAGMLLIGGSMDRMKKVSTYVPVYLSNAPQAVIEKYKEANGVDSIITDGDKVTYYNSVLPLRRVSVMNEDAREKKDIIADAYYNLMVKAQRAQVLPTGQLGIGGAYQGYGNDDAPYSLTKRNAMFNGRTEDGIVMTTVVSDQFSSIANDDGEYVDTWYVYLPQEVIDGTVPEHSVPLVMTYHGGGDDPRQFVEGNGFLELAGRKRFAMVAPFHQNMGFGTSLNDATNSKLCEVLPALIRYILEQYPALDPSRVYATGYSMGSGATIRTVYGDASVLAAAVPMALGDVTIEDKMLEQFANVDIPILFTCSENDMAMLNVFDPANTVLGPAYYAMVERFMRYNEMDYAAKVGELDFDKYPISGWRADSLSVRKLNGEYMNYTWLFNNDKGVPMVGVSVTEAMQHALYPPYADLFWEFVKHYSRDQETGEIVYNPYVD